MRATLAALGALAVLASLAAPRAAAAKDAPAWADLPVGRVTEPPPAKQKPAAIGAREKAPGMFVVAPRFAGRMPDGARHVTVVGDAKTAEHMRAGAGFSLDGDRSACFMESTARFGDATTPTWDTNQMWQVNLWQRSPSNPQAGVAAVHAERLVERNAALVLESTDAWIDPATRGARTIGRAELPLKLVGSAIGGVKVYAARAKGSDGTERVEFVIVHDTRGGVGVGALGSMTAMRQDGRGARGSGCSHIRVSLAAADGGESAVVVVPVMLPALDRREERAGEAKDAARDAKTLPGGPPMQEKEVRTRDLQVHVSVSKTSRDETPVLAVSFGWASREQTQRTFVRVD